MPWRRAQWQCSHHHYHSWSSTQHQAQSTSVGRHLPVLTKFQCLHQLSRAPQRVHDSKRGYHVRYASQRRCRTRNSSPTRKRRPVARMASPFWSTIVLLSCCCCLVDKERAYPLR